MVQAFFKTHKYLLEHLEVPVRRGLMEKINWNNRLIGIIGARGVGKTNFLLDYVSSTFGLDKSCLYVNLNSLYFADRTIIDFADEFQKTGGKTLVLDQIFKYPNWTNELIYCYDHFPDLQIIFSGSPLMRNQKEDPELESRAALYKLEGFSFRDYINYKTGENFQAYTLAELQKRHTEIATHIIEKIKPLAYYTDYLHHGYYPYFLEERNYLENLLKNINLVLEIDISYLQQIELKYLPKLRKLLYIIASSAPFQPNISKLSTEVETSRATIINYLKYLNQANLIHLLYEDDCDSLKKPAEIYLQNPNLLFSVANGDVDQNILNKTFFCSQINNQHDIGYCKDADFIIDQKWLFNVGEKDSNPKGKKNIYTACEMEEIGKGEKIPLWLFGFLY
jgi:predicted AAA+ superfamily ATPase